jgi:two-component system NarL family sensor kinase
MLRIQRLAVIVVAWVTPVSWIAVALFAGPSDGTRISSPTAAFGTVRWGDSVTVLETYGDTPLREGDVIETVDGRIVADWVGAGGEHWESGDVVTYRILRQGEGLDRIMQVDVTLTAYPLAAALADNLAPVVVALGLLVCGSVVFWVRPRDPATGALLGLGATALAGLTAYPLGLGVIDLAGSRGVWPHVGGEVLYAVGLGFLLVAALTFPWTRPWLRRRPAAGVLALIVPFLGYAAWLLITAQENQTGPARLQSLITIALPALLVTLPIVIAAQVESYVRAPGREDRVAIRLVLLGLATALVVRVLLVDLPQRLAGQQLVPSLVLALLLTPTVLACLVMAVLRFRLAEVDAVLRRALLQLLVATCVGTLFLAAVGTVNLATETSVESMLAGGVIALMLLPLALGLRRFVSRVVYGDREFPYRVVSQLRQLEPRTTPEDALAEMLSVLCRSLRLSFASVEIHGQSPGDQVSTSIGVARGEPSSVVLQVAGATVGELRLEVEPERQPFGPRDRRLLEDVGSQVGSLVQAVAINRELQRSREQLIAAREEERRRVRRDLHDGLGPSLATMVMKLEVAHDLIGQDPDGAAQLVGQLTDQTRLDIGEIRRLVDGLRPPALDQFGLVSALRQRADEHNLAARAAHGTMVWTIQASDDVEPLPAAVEVAAYRIVIEAVNNALQHSRAPTCHVELRRSPDTLDIEVHDAGAGLPAATRLGVGIGSMRERAEELGGTFELSSTVGHGTRVLVRLPLVPIDESPR